MNGRPKDRLSRLVWSILDECPDTFVGDPEFRMKLNDIVLIKAYIERLEIGAGFTHIPTTREVMQSILKDRGVDE
jgi:hypothetical protein